MLTPQMAVQRALSAVGHHTVYRLGKGGFSPASPFPWDEHGECDCSGFVAWCLGLSRHTSFPFYAQLNGGWLETTAIVRDARSTLGVFDEVPWEKGRPGDLVVYGDSGGHQGHVGLIREADEAGPRSVIHCSLGNWNTRRDAIQEGSPSLWKMHGGLVARCALLGLA